MASLAGIKCARKPELILDLILIGYLRHWFIIPRPSVTEIFERSPTDENSVNLVSILSNGKAPIIILGHANPNSL